LAEGVLWFRASASHFRAACRDFSIVSFFANAEISPRMMTSDGIGGLNGDPRM